MMHLEYNRIMRDFFLDKPVRLFRVTKDALNTGKSRLEVNGYGVNKEAITHGHWRL